LYSNELNGLQIFNPFLFTGIVQILKFYSLIEDFTPAVIQVLVLRLFIGELLPSVRQFSILLVTY